MLVLTRRVGEGILIGDDIEIKITKVEGRQVHVAIKAPLSIPILRTELVARKQSKLILPSGIKEDTARAVLGLPEREADTDGNK